MANTETTVSNLKINRLTQTQLKNATSLSNSELYMVDPEFTGGKLLVTDSNGDIVESIITESDINGKVNTSDCYQIYPVIETYVSGTSWYRIYSDGWCEQGGHFDGNSAGYASVLFLKEFADTAYNIQISLASSSDGYVTNAAPVYWSVCYKTVSSFQTFGSSTASLSDKDWRACGYLANNQYTSGTYKAYKP